MSGVARRAVTAEWTKLRSVPSTTWTALAVVGITVGLTAFMAATSSTDANQAGGLPGDDDVVANALFGVWLGQIAIVALGALAATAEFDTGMIRATLSAIPRRGVAFEAKVAIVAGTAFAIGAVTSVASFLVAQPLQHGNGYNAPAYPHPSLTDPIVVRAVLGTALYLTLVALFAMGVAVIVRHTAAAITVGVTLVLAPTVVLGFFTGTIREVMQWLSPVAGMSVQVTRERFDNPPYGPWVGLGLTATWAIGALLVGAWMLRRRDV